MEDFDVTANQVKTEAGLTPAELIKKHNADPKHVITDEEMNHLKIGGDDEDRDELDRKIKRKEEEDNRAKHENNSYDILDA